MASSTTKEIVHDFPPFIRVYGDGRVERFMGNDVVPSSINPDTETGLSARLYIPKTPNPYHKLHLLVYFHGSGFCLETAFSPTYHNYLNSLVAEANIVVVSVDYRRAPEHLLSIPYDNSWAVVKWVASQLTANGGEVWLKEYVDFDRVFFAGDSAGGNIAHNMAIRVRLDGAKLVGMVLIHPYFGGKGPVGFEGADGNIIGKAVADKFWLFVYPSSNGSDDPLFNPVVDPKFSSMVYDKVLVCVAEKDFLKDRGWYYKEELGRSGWGGVMEIMEVAGKDHVFHLFKPTCDNAVALLKRVACFLNENNA
ncbi:hypothetical protein TEA_006924 [Camellia sinensis var. sinensis]|uniref:Alpha/beta hydrolase fold-3 domain-containing protein n=1 Tax=Camellia sinensis var. sinensis TaxID=542762 RepID=A0A4S4D2S8_CAMSN|nr:hypothetical protein TEA_006924 [Camellia sinensis var. sinensis]